MRDKGRSFQAPNYFVYQRGVVENINRYGGPAFTYRYFIDSFAIVKREVVNHVLGLVAKRG